MCTMSLFAYCTHACCVTVSSCFCTAGGGHTEEDRETEAEAKAAAGKIFTYLFQHKCVLMSTVCITTISYIIG